MDCFAWSVCGFSPAGMPGGVVGLGGSSSSVSRLMSVMLAGGFESKCGRIFLANRACPVFSVLRISRSV